MILLSPFTTYTQHSLSLGGVVRTRGGEPKLPDTRAKPMICWACWAKCPKYVLNKCIWLYNKKANTHTQLQAQACTGRDNTFPLRSLAKVAYCQLQRKSLNLTSRNTDADTYTHRGVCVRVHSLGIQEITRILCKLNNYPALRWTYLIFIRQRHCYNYTPTHTHIHTNTTTQQQIAYL